jgi:hypothetical protein
MHFYFVIIFCSSIGLFNSLCFPQEKPKAVLKMKLVLSSHRTSFFLNLWSPRNNSSKSSAALRGAAAHYLLPSAVTKMQKASTLPGPLFLDVGALSCYHSPVYHPLNHHGALNRAGF